MNFSEKENRILEFWAKNKIFDKLKKKNEKGKKWSFLDGPITANNPMGVHHAWGRTYKDLFQRYKAMQGFNLRYQSGFDCQGLWVEVEVEKELKFKSKKDIEKYGIEKFVKKCKERVKKYSAIQTKQSIRLGQWMDWEHSYYTMSSENNYAIWHFLKKCKEKGLLYKGRDSVPWCPRCGTAISQHEILTEEYKELSHKSVFVKYPVIGEKNTYFLVWTTTPWTLPGNVALAVHPDFDYVKIKDESGTIYILLKEKANLIEQGEIIEEIKGKELEGIKYKGIFDEMLSVKQTLGSFEHCVILWKEITQEEGTGIVHIAPGCGAEDFQLSKELDFPVIDLSDQESKYRQGFGELSGIFVGGNEARERVFQQLKDKKNLFKIEDYTHRYPTCWRCKSELIFRVVDEWYIKMDKLREGLKQSAKQIKWIPGFCLDREIDWLDNMRDWLISKKRYWGLALPIFECECGNVEVIGSEQELKQRAVEGWEEFEGHTPHRPFVDNIKIKCSKCGKLISRIKDVGTPWLDAGIVPFSTLSDDNRADDIPYFHNKREEWEKWFPADFITESFPGQFKNWFYVLLVMSYVLEQKPPFKTLLGYATVVDEQGEEMHKSKGNAIWFDDGVEKIGADVMRWMYAKQNPANNMRFGFNVADDNRKKLLTLINCYTFFHYNKDIKFEIAEKSNNQTQDLLNKWIVSRFNNLIIEVEKNLNKYNAMKASQAIEEFFIQDLSLWIIRRSRKNFNEAKNVLFNILLDLTKLIAPFMPFMAEYLYQDIKTKEMPLSVHLNDFPKYDEQKIDKDLEKDMKSAREIVSLALAKRTELGIKIRQPLQKLKIKTEFVRKELEELIKQELNVKQIEFNVDMEKEIELDTKITKELEQEGDLREIIRQIQSLRKKQGLMPSHGAVIYYSTSSDEIIKILEKNKNEILSLTRSSELKQNDFSKNNYNVKKVDLRGQELKLAIIKK